MIPGNINSPMWVGEECPRSKPLCVKWQWTTHRGGQQVNQGIIQGCSSTDGKVQAGIPKGAPCKACACIYV